MTKYVHKPTEVDAIRWTGRNTAAVRKWIHDQATEEMANVAMFVVRKSVSKGIWANVAGDEWGEEVAAAVYDFMHDAYDPVKEGQWLISGVLGEIYPCDHGVFVQAYEKKGEG